MANKQLFNSVPGALIPQTDTKNAHGSPAFAFTPKHALAQYASTGCLNATFYADAETQLAEVIKLTGQVDAEFVAKTAVYTREKGLMKDMPALLCATLSKQDPELFRRTFNRVIDNGRVLRSFIQVMRSGCVGRKSLGTVAKRLTQQWLEQRSDEQLFKDSLGNSPSMADVIKMVHPKPRNVGRAALYGYLLSRPHDAAALPSLVQEYEAFKGGSRQTVPNVPFQMLTALDLGPEQWREIARHAPWQMTRMNLNTFLRHQVFEDAKLVSQVAERLADPQKVRAARAFPYQLLAAFKSVDPGIPGQIRDALQDAMEVAISNVPSVNGKVYICPDVSGSMQSSVTGFREGATSSVRCIDVAALVAAAILRKNPSAEVLPFSTDVIEVQLNGRDTVMTNAEKLASIGGGGTNCSAPLAELNRRQARGDLVVFVSDNQSWVDASNAPGTETMKQWNQFKRLNPQARMACIDIQPLANTQAAESKDVMNLGGFSDDVFRVLAAFSEGQLESGHWVAEIESVSL